MAAPSPGSGPNPSVYVPGWSYPPVYQSPPPAWPHPQRATEPKLVPVKLGPAPPQATPRFSPPPVLYAAFPSVYNSPRGKTPPSAQLNAQPVVPPLPVWGKGVNVDRKKTIPKEGGFFNCWSPRGYDERDEVIPSNFAPDSPRSSGSPRRHETPRKHEYFRRPDSPRKPDSPREATRPETPRKIEPARLESPRVGYLPQSNLDSPRRIESPRETYQPYLGIEPTRKVEYHRRVETPKKVEVPQLRRPETPRKSEPRQQTETPRSFRSADPEFNSGDWLVFHTDAENETWTVVIIGGKMMQCRKKVPVHIGKCTYESWAAKASHKEAVCVGTLNPECADCFVAYTATSPQTHVWMAGCHIHIEPMVTVSFTASTRQGAQTDASNPNHVVFEADSNGSGEI